MNSQIPKQELRKQILKNIGSNTEEAYPSSKLREMLIRAECSDARSFVLDKEDKIK